MQKAKWKLISAGLLEINFIIRSENMAIIAFRMRLAHMVDPLVFLSRSLGEGK